MKKIMLLAAMAASLMTSCDAMSNGNGKDDPDGQTMEYVYAQRRSAKRGISGRMQMKTDVELLSPGVGWQYNWSSTISFGPEMKANNMVFYPMSWNNQLNDTEVRNLIKQHPEIEYILAYNEPNLTDQANMTPQKAAGYWPSLKNLANELGLKIIAPAVNYGTLSGYSEPTKWLDEFFACDGVSIDDVAGLAVHCYMPSAEALKSFIQKFYKYNKPIYMTEFCAASGTITNDAQKQLNFMCDALNYMESDPHVGGYSWFMSRGSGNWSAISLLNNSPSSPALTDLGLAYVNFSSFDKGAWYRVGEAVPAEHYSANNMSETATTTTWLSAPRVRPTTDSTGTLELCDFFVVGSWVEYQITAAEAGTYSLNIRYSNLVDGKLALSIDGTEVEEFTLAKTEDDAKWTNYTVEKIELAAGNHTVRYTLRKGRVNMNWFCFNKQ